MIWLTWRQFRAQAYAALATLAVIGIAFVITGPHLNSLYDTSGIPTCQAHGDCGTVISNFINELKGIDSILYFVGLGVLYVGPGLIGVFWGAPLVTRELEAGTFRMTWNQSVTRTRWIAVKLGLVGLASMAAAGLLSLMMSWWASPINQANALNTTRNGSSSLNRLTPLLFGASGIVPVGYAAFAFALGVTAGVLIRRTLPAMAITLAVFAVIQIVMPTVVRPHLIAPGHVTVALSSAAINELSVGQNGHITVLGAVNHTWRLDPLEPDHHHRRPRLHRPGPPVLPVAQLPGLPGLDQQAAPPADGDLSARQPLLGLPVVRDGDLPGGRPCPGRVLHLVDPPPPAFPDRPAVSPPRRAGSGPSGCRRGPRSRLPSRRTPAGAARRT